MSDSILFETSTVADGNMALRYGDAEVVNENRARFFARVGVAANTIALMEVNHGSSVVCVDGRAAPGTVELVAAEALITRESDITLALLTADCLPVGFYDHGTGAMALVHLGWRPIDRGLVHKVVDELSQTYGPKPNNLEVLIGPGIGADSYAFDLVSQDEDSLWKPHLKLIEGRIHIDLAGRVVSDLESVGVRREKVTISPIDTARSPDHFSHYRSREKGEPEGRMMTVLSLR